MKVYIVTSGDYSDYTIDGVFRTKEAAKKYIKEFVDNNEWVDNDDCFEIEVYNVKE